MTINKLSEYIFIILILSGIYADAQSGKPLFKGNAVVVSYTYRKNFEKDFPSTLDIIKQNGITDIEFSNLFGKTAQQLRSYLDEKGLKCSSFGIE